MTRADRITQCLSKAFSPTKLDLIDDSHKHAGHSGARPEGETHYTLKIESDAFTGMNRIERHRAILRLLENEQKTGLHALVIQARAPGET